MNHDTCVLVLEMNAATSLEEFSDHSSVFAIHNPPDGAVDSSDHIPLTVVFPPHLMVKAKTFIRKGTHFTVTGRLKYNGRKTSSARETFSVRANMLSIHAVLLEQEAASSKTPH